MPGLLRRLFVAALIVWYSFLGDQLPAESQDPLHRLDPAAWGDDHIGESLPEYVTGDECLFCHRQIGPTWQDNRHQLTIRLANQDDQAMIQLRKLSPADDLANDVTFLLGSQRTIRFLKRSADYGKFDILSTRFIPPIDASSGDPGKLSTGEDPRWEATTFADRCAACHTTAVNNKTRSFAAISTDCYACHGNVQLDHAKGVSHVLLSNKNRVPRQVVSICGQCHLRGGKSVTSGLSYPNTFVAGDNLFRDFQVVFSDSAINALPNVDQHIYLNARDVAVFGQTSMTCLTCHNVHNQSSQKHQSLRDARICATCHMPDTDNSKLRATFSASARRKSHSPICDY